MPSSTPRNFNYKMGSQIYEERSIIKKMVDVCMNDSLILEKKYWTIHCKYSARINPIREITYAIRNSLQFLSTSLQRLRQADIFKSYFIRVI